MVSSNPLQELRGGKSTTTVGDVQFPYSRLAKRLAAPDWGLYGLETFPAWINRAKASAAYKTLMRTNL